ncbi:dihydrofolate reductase family protein [Actinomadura madurae]|uniref:dihydrofolate reductase family protein n=1 Tax=Actinomadura madurae TaxID=1993 RepID=UPI0020265159|nr:dihydrofolate reductase family protein [Actinomadura madurae]URN05772.1 dihydrofolate reductase family protein [Actinomadura madurae]
MSVIVIEFITMDGIVSDPDGSAGTPTGGWAFRHGPETVAGDKFRLGETLDQGVMLLGRRTWQLFSRIWPGRDDPFAARMNAAPKLVASRTLTDTSAWATSTLIDGDLIDEYRLLTFPTILGTGERLFPTGTTRRDHAAAFSRSSGTTTPRTWEASATTLLGRTGPFRSLDRLRPGLDTTRSPPNPERRVAPAASHVAAIANALGIAAPVLVLHGGQDRIVPCAHGGSPNAAALPNCGCPQTTDISPS